MAKFDVATGDLDPAFHPNFSGGVKAIDIEGSDLYVGGGFGTVTGTRHKNIVKLDTATGAVSAAFQGGTDRAVWCLVTSPLGNTVWVGGLFGLVNGVPRVGIGGLDGDTGAMVGPAFDHMEPPVYGIDTSPDGSLLFAAQKSNQGGGWRVSDGAAAVGGPHGRERAGGQVLRRQRLPGLPRRLPGRRGAQAAVRQPLHAAPSTPTSGPRSTGSWACTPSTRQCDQLVVGGQWDIASGVARKNIAVFSP